MSEGEVYKSVCKRLVSWVERRERFVTTDMVAELEFLGKSGDRWKHVYVTPSTDGHRDTNSSQKRCWSRDKTQDENSRHNTTRK